MARLPAPCCRRHQSVIAAGSPSRTLVQSVEHRWTKAGWAYFFCVPSWARKAGCPIHNEALGTDLDAATERAERILLPAFDAWQSGDTKTATTPAVAAPGTLDWVFA
jgi:hypothetical protein